MIRRREQDENREQHIICLVVGSGSSSWPGQEPLSNHDDKMTIAMGWGMDMIAEVSFGHLDVPIGVSPRLLWGCDPFVGDRDIYRIRDTFPCCPISTW